jgi:hypothetical protein
MTPDAGRVPSGQALAVPATPLRVDGPSGFDPSRVAAALGPAQRKVLLSLTIEWGEASDHQCAKRMWYGVRGRGGLRLSEEVHLIEHKHRTDNCWRLNGLGVIVRDAIAIDARKRRDAEERPDPKGESAVPGRQSPNLPSPSSEPSP